MSDIEAGGPREAAVEGLVVLEDLGEGQGPEAKDSKEEDVERPEQDCGAAEAVEDSCKVPGLYCFT